MHWQRLQASSLFPPPPLPPACPACRPKGISKGTSQQMGRDRTSSPLTADALPPSLVTLSTLSWVRAVCRELTAQQSLKNLSLGVFAPQQLQQKEMPKGWARLSSTLTSPMWKGTAFHQASSAASQQGSVSARPGLAPGHLPHLVPQPGASKPGRQKESQDA